MGDDLIGAKPRPRMLLIGIAAELVPDLTELAGYCEVTENPAFVNLSEFDCLVTTESWNTYARYGDSPLAAHMSVVSFVANASPMTLEKLNRPEASGLLAVGTGSAVICNQFLPPTAPEPLRRLIRETLLPSVQQRRFQLHYECRPQRPEDRVLAAAVLTPFLMTAENHILAGSFQRDGGQSVCWLLPADVLHPVDWVKAALRSWHEKAPGRFPRVPDWSSESRWQTPTELALHKSIAEVVAQRDRLVVELTAEEAELRARLQVLAAATDKRERRLVTAAGDDLVDAVIEALDELGFEVANADDSAEQGDLLEDLRVTDPEQPGWEVLAEVRGYNAGGKLGDLSRIERFVLRFYKAHNRQPSMKWYVVNQFRNDDPSTRPPLLNSNPTEVAEFAADGGLLIDTAQLFRLLVSVRAGELAKGEARSRIRTASPRLDV